MNVIQTLVIAAGLWGCVALGIAEGQTYTDRDGNGLIDILYIEQLDSMRYNLTGACEGSICNGYELKRSLDFRDSLSYRNYRSYISSTHDSSFYARGEGWRPVGNSSSVAFNTSFEGNNYTLDNLFINRSTTDYIGLFGYTQSNSIVRNIGLRNVSVTGNHFVGGLVGSNNGGTISQSYATGAVTGAYNVGGLVGWHNGGTISQSYATGAVAGAYNVGGLVGVNWYGGTISQSYATGAVTGTQFVGGLVGYNYNGTINESFATGSVTGRAYSVGGLVGVNDNGIISQSYATGAVSGTQFVGGLVGWHYNGTVRHGYWNVDAPQTVNGTVRSNNNTVGIDYRLGSVIETHIRGLTLSALESSTGTAADTIQELGPGFIYKQGFLPYIHRGARLTVHSIHFTQTIPSWTNIDTNSIVANVIQGTDTTRATLTVDGIAFTANIIGTTNITSPYTLRNIQNGTGEGIVGKYGTKIHFAALGMKTYGDAPFVLSATSSAHLPLFFSASNTIVSIKSDTVIIHGGGTVSITAYSLENDTVVFGFTNQILAIRKSIPMDRDLDGLIDILYIEQLDSMRYNLTGACEGSICNGYELKRSLDFRDSLSYRNYRSYISNTHDSSFYARGEGWRPVGSATYVNGTLQEENPFNTLFEGNRFTLNHLFINRVSTHFVGLFGYTGSNSIVRNIGLRTVSVTGAYNAGGLVGWNNGTITQSYATGYVHGSTYVGGLVGWNNGGTISQSYATGSVTGAYSVGGLVGVNWYGGTISQSYATVSVSSNAYNIGGLVGYNYYGTINQSYATGAVSGTQYVGGLVGGNDNGTVRHGYWNVDAPQTVNGTVRSTHNTVGIDYKVGSVIETHIRGLTLSALESPTGTAANTIQELGPGFIYKQGFLPYIHRGARLTVHSIHFTQTIPSITDIDTNSIVANVIQGTNTTRATLTVDGIPFTANIIGTTNITSPYTLRNIQNGTGEGIVGKYGTKIHFAALGMKTYGDAPFVLSATSSAHLPVFFSASNTIVSIKSDTVIIHGGGTVNITAYSLENDTVVFGFTNQILAIRKSIPMDRDLDGLIDILYIEQLDSMRYNLTGACEGSICNGYELKRSLDFRDSLSYRNYRSYISSTHDSSFYARGEGWRPVGSATSFFNGPVQGNPYNAPFEGNRFTIDHLFINRSSNPVGLFGYTQSNSIVRNIGIRNVSVTGNDFVGGLVGWNNGGTISQSYATGAVTGAYSVGGLVGVNWYGTISQSYATGAVSGIGNVGGLVGWNNGTINQSYATGAVSGTQFVGGLVGWNNGTINQSYATGAVSGTQFVGGLVGWNYYGTVHHGYWNVDAPQTVNGTVRSTHNTVGIDYRVGPVIETHIRSLTLSALESPTGTAADTIQELGPGFIYKQGFLPYIHRGARLTVHSIHFTQTIPSWTNIDTNSIVANVIQGTDTTRATLTVDGIPFTANIIGTTNITSPYTLRNIQNGTGEGIVGKYGTKIHFASLGMKTYGDAPFVLSATSSAHLPLFFSASNTIVSISHNTVIIHGGGTVSITAYSLENDTVVFGFTNQILAIRKSIPMDRDLDGLIDILYIEQLDSIRYNLTGACEGSICNGYELKRSLDFRDSLSYRNYRSYISSTHDSSFYARGEGWRPVGSATYVNGTLQEGNPFNTLFEGNGNTIDHLYIQRSTTSYVGLFGYTQSNSSIRNIGLRNVSVSGNNLVGGLVGWNNGTIIQSYATGAVSGSDIVGGLVGVNWYGGTISQSYATGAVSGIVETGGLAGRNHGTISQSYATGAVTGGAYSIGGLVGWNHGTISQSYATGAVSGTQFVGGLIGINYNGTVHHGYWNVDAPQTVNGTVRSTHNTVGIDYRVGPVIETHIRGLILSALESPTGTAADTIQELGPGFIYKQGFLPYIHRGARLTVHSIHFTQTIPSWTNIDTNSIVANVIQGTDTTRATLTVDGIPFTANIIGTTNITSPYTLRNIQNGTGEGIVGKYGTKIHFASLGMKTYGDAPFVVSARSTAGLPILFSASNTIVSISHNTVIIHGGGTVNITAYSLENDTVVFGFTNQILAIRKSIPMDRDLDGLIDILYIEQLDSMRYNLTGACAGSVCNGYELKRSLDFRDSLSYRNYRSYISSTHDSSFYALGEGWRPVGSATSFFNGPVQGNPYNAPFEGNRFTIDHLFINRSSNPVGLFGYTQSNSSIRNIGLRNVSVSGNNLVGGLVGWNNGTITQSFATGYVSGNVHVGGLVGRNNVGTISKSYATGYVSGSIYVGGLVGTNNGTINQSYATGAVSGIGNVGGLVGVNNNGTISQSYATGAVSGNDYYVGGLVGVNWYGGTISQSYATGAVSGTQFVGGLVGWHYNGTVHHGYWNVDAPQTVNGTVRSTHNTVGIDYRVGPVIETHIRSLTLSALESPTGTAADTIQELGPGFIYKQGFLPYIHRGARLTVHSIHFTQTIPSITDIDTNSIVANVIQGTDTTRATLTVDGIPFTANIIGTTNITSPYTLRNIQNGTGEGIVGKYGTKIHFAALGMKTYGDAPFVLSATSSAHLPLFFSASNTIVSISNNTVIIHGGGTVNITAYSLETDTIGFTSVTQILTIHKVFQSIEFGVLASKTFGDAPFVVSASSSAHLSVFFSASNTLVRILNNVVIIQGAGTVNITAYSLENDTVVFASATQILTIHKGVQSIEFGVLASKTFGDAPFVLSARSTAGFPILFSASNTIVNIKSNTIIINGAGTVNIIAYCLENNDYFRAFTTRILTISKGIQDIEFRVLASKTFGDAPFVVSARSTAGFPILFSASNTIVNIKSNTIIINGAGTVNIIAYCLENNDYFRAFTTRIFTISKGIQSIEFGVLASKILGDAPFVLSARSTAGLPILFSASNAFITIQNNTVSMNKAGAVHIRAYNEGNEHYLGASATQILFITKPIDTVTTDANFTFAAIPNMTVGQRYFLITRSQNPIYATFKSSNERIAIINQDILTAIAAGTITITAHQEAFAPYRAATARQTVIVIRPTSIPPHPLTPIETKNSAIRIFPNPTKDYITIQTNEKISSVKVYDIMGKSYELGIKNYELGIQNYELGIKNYELGSRVDIKILPKGEYILVIYGKNGEVLKAEKVMKY